MDPNDQNQSVPPGDDQGGQGGIQPPTPSEPTPVPDVPGAPASEPEVPGVPPAEGEIAPPPPVVEEEQPTPGGSGSAI